MESRQLTWNGDEGRTLKLYRPCPCGCDRRDGEVFAGYISASDENGDGFTIMIESEDVFQEVAKHIPVQEN
jgi:hypothetical protein